MEQGVNVQPTHIYEMYNNLADTTLVELDLMYN